MNSAASDKTRQDKTRQDWIGNSKSIYTPLGASNHSDGEREINDYYATSPSAIDYLLKDGKAELAHKVWECCCGAGHLSKRLEEYGYDVRSTDLIYRGYGKGEVDFFEQNEPWNGTILTNPPYSKAQAVVEHALDIITPGNKVYMFLKLQFLEGKARRKLWDTKQLKTVYVSTSRIVCAKNGAFEEVTSSAVAYAWFEWEKGFYENPVIKWIN